MKLKKIYQYQLQHMEHYQFADRVLTLCKEANNPKLTAVLTPLQAAIAKEDAALNQPREQEGTKAVAEADRKRDQSYQALKLLVSVHEHSNDAATVASADAVSRILRTYPDVLTANYDKETGLIRNLIADLRTPALTPHVAKLTLAAYITRLEADNNTFDKLFHTRVKATRAIGSFDVKQLRIDTDTALAAVIRRIEALDELEPSPAITTLIGQYNSLVDNRKALLSHRAGTNETARIEREAEKSKTLEEYRAMLAPLFPELEASLGLSAGSLSFTGSFVGSGARRHYELAVAGQTETIWVRISKEGKPVKVEEKKK